uniref:Uncharacterized protein n=1 Tax=Rousettus aegyptiacus TaxID=9407 RepID=A0A7J8HR88_ROUAE|nr:hypothetical protein HJG63_010980 [Rousettus aegyptiacus]
MAVTYQGPSACILLLLATFPALLPDVTVVTPAEPGPEPPGWPATVPPETSRPPKLLPPGEQSRHSAPVSSGFLDVLLMWFHSIPILPGVRVARYTAMGYHWEAEGHMSSTCVSPTQRPSRVLWAIQLILPATPLVSTMLIKKGRFRW